jgi:glycerol dehydrogenase
MLPILSRCVAAKCKVQVDDAAVVVVRAGESEERTMLSVFSSPSRYTQGKNATAELGTEMKALGLEGPALIIAGRSARKLLSETWKQSLGAASIKHNVHPFGGECSLAEIERGKAEAKKQGARVIVGAGGGKLLDAARAVAADLDLPVVNCPTLASSDAPCSALSVIYTDEGVFLEYRFYRKNPELVLVDTQVIAQSPPRLLVAGMGDALSTWFEAKTCVDGNVRNMRGGASTQSALTLAELCYRTLLADGADALRAVRLQVVTPALERLVEANTLLSGLGFESSGLAAAHAIHNGLTAAPGTHDYFHGEKVAFGTLTQLVLEGKPRTLVEEVLRFAAEVGLPITLAKVGLADVPRELLEQVAARATAKGETIHNEPFAVTPDMVADALLAADAVGRAWKNQAS